MASSKEEALANLFEKIVLQHSNDQFSTSDPVKTNDKVDNKVVDVEKEEKFQLPKDSDQAKDSSNIKLDDNTFVSSLFEQGQSSKESEDEFDPTPIIDWLKFNVGDDEACQKLLHSLKTKVDKANDLINQLRAMGHDIDDDYVVDLNFFDNE
ncbi:hypothetical protein CTI12_AA339830 [Artemisia annua]|uniref:Uncharacterized protein n=1 Tax=Artemisia annua TaxID=35608 RepID=A0A2U1MU92_ARTAN|nr:hypothetical protein CTI12_AA339830 [Artemisia annua]